MPDVLFIEKGMHVWDKFQHLLHTITERYYHSQTVFTP